MEYKFKRVCPCKDCPPAERFRACWDNCEKYIEWKKQWSKIREAKEKNSIVEDYRKREMKKNIKHNGKDIFER